MSPTTSLYAQVIRTQDWPTWKELHDKEEADKKAAIEADRIYAEEIQAELSSEHDEVHTMARAVTRLQLNAPDDVYLDGKRQKQVHVEYIHIFYLFANVHTYCLSYY